MKHITSHENPIIKKAAGLRQRKAREKEGLYLIEGIHLCGEALGIVERIEFLFVRESQWEEKSDGELREIVRQFEEKGVKTAVASDKIFDKLADTETPQGLVAVIRRRDWDPESFFAADKRGGHGNLLVLDRIQDPGNAGTLLRTAEAAGFQGVLAVKGTTDLYSPKVVRAAAGSLFRLPILFTENAGGTAGLLHSRGKRIVAATPYCDSFHFQERLDRNVALIVGNEAGGISEAFLQAADSRVKIPMCEPVESLNAAVAAGILMYESLRQNFHKEAEEKKQSCRQS